MTFSRSRSASTTGRVLSKIRFSNPMLAASIVITLKPTMSAKLIRMVIGPALIRLRAVGMRRDSSATTVRSGAAAIQLMPSLPPKAALYDDTASVQTTTASATMAIIFNGFISKVPSVSWPTTIVRDRLTVRRGRGGSLLVLNERHRRGFVSGDETRPRGVTSGRQKKCGVGLALSGFGRVPRIEFHWEYLAVLVDGPGHAAHHGAFGLEQSVVSRP